MITAAVITVPAAFSVLQCEATGRAAKLAGFNNAPLLQEPIAAAVAYGASVAGNSQRWLVFDLGGGTDVAIVSTLQRAAGRTGITRATTVWVGRY